VSIMMFFLAPRETVALAMERRARAMCFMFDVGGCIAQPRLVSELQHACCYIPCQTHVILFSPNHSNAKK
jgi:hypothetical protein